MLKVLLREQSKLRTEIQKLNKIIFEKLAIYRALEKVAFKSKSRRGSRGSYEYTVSRKGAIYKKNCLGLTPIFLRSKYP